MMHLLLVLGALTQAPKFEFARDGVAVPKSAIHTRHLSTGVTEITITAP